MNDEEEIIELLKGLRIRIMDEVEYTLTDEQAKELAHEFVEDNEKWKNRKLE